MTFTIVIFQLQKQLQTSEMELNETCANLMSKMFLGTLFK